MGGFICFLDSIKIDVFRLSKKNFLDAHMKPPHFSFCKSLVVILENRLDINVHD